MALHSQLNHAQQQAVDHKNGPLLILAGAGAGKTRTLAHRIQSLITNGVAPEKILAVTFTNKASGDMRERIMTLLEESPIKNRPVYESSSPYIATFHSLGVHILRNESDLLSVPKRFNIFDRTDSLRAIKEAMRKEGIDIQQIEPRKVLGSISGAKGEGVTLDIYTDMAGSYYEELVSGVWSRYTDILREEKAFDFDDLLLETVALLKKNASVKEKYRNKWEYVHIDEYQDTNKIQDELAFFLAHPKNNICVVGDMDQTIYTWRGARPGNMLSFEKRYPGTEVIKLEENYRSTQTIVTASNQIIERNKNRIDKTLFTKNNAGEDITYYGALDESDEADFVVNTINSLSSSVPLTETAVLYRANFQSRAFEEALLNAGIQYQLVGTRFFERKEVKDVLSFVRYTQDKNSVGDLKRIVNTPPRGIGKVTLMRILTNRENECTPAVRKKIDDFNLLVERISGVLALRPLSEALTFIITESGLHEHLKNGAEDDQERLENVYELVSLSKKYDVLSSEEGVQKLLDDAALASDQDDLSRAKNGVRLMTVHAAKGLEFDVVFVTGLEDGLFPHEGMGEDRDEEEERRLFYVAITRAKKKLFLTSTSSRSIFGVRKINLPSEFLSDIDESLITISGNGMERKEKIIYLDLNE